ncbi:N-acetylmuramoyl-L-alanine amidase [Streptomyces sp. H10-C2]|uniref:N-acetylmuramoyl-L-alanine amidase n=1 Tax=unclassified Streptomyces TaxID=2593676 RepID=UPI0024B9D5F9|nr:MULTISPECIES: N-acetylmuramoyl-L-alanine amidase [unclassified Streptomyces]MDJ0344177.1 N-acetylmuramoyl-L-alanine amidase [Streptomyces sp. PH10-H1]MDJ0373064.1 N-acetylmuramoyl-L-alanine amidase [Streptomyces sp. H10-C2]
MTAAAAAAALLPVLSSAPSANAADQPATSSLQQAFSDAAQHYQVPASVLLSVSYMESRWDTHQGLPSVTAGYGPMHLTDARTALTDFPQKGDGGDDARGDDPRPLTGGAQVPAPDLSQLPATLTTLDRAAGLTGLPAQDLRTDPAANVAGGAALIADAQKSLGRPLTADPADWYGAVARFSGADDSATATAFADDVYDVLRQGESRTTDSGQSVALAAAPGIAPDTAQAAGLGLKHANDAGTECPRGVGCEWLPAPYQETAPGNYGNHDLADRPNDQKIDYIVIHDTEGTWDTALKLVRTPTYLAWHYTIRSADGHIDQHLKTKDVGWHAGNWSINAKSVGIEHEGFLIDPGTWYTESMYRTSARLVAYLARKYGIPLDRQHILGHDNVPGPTGAYIGGMHTDPGPYWDWAHYFQLMGAPLHATAGPGGGLVTIRPDYDENQPLYTGCVKAGDTCPARGSEAVRLYTAPSEDAPLVKDIGLHKTGDSTTGVNDVGARASTGQQYAVAERQGDWTAVWYLGQKGWFHNPRSQPTAVNAWGFTVSPKPGLTDIPVYGRAYPEASAYPAGVPVQAIVPMPYKLLAGQEYVIGNRVHGEYFYSTTFDTTGHRVVRGNQVYYEIQFGHRVEYVKAEDVTVLPSQVGAPR